MVHLNAHDITVVGLTAAFFYGIAPLARFLIHKFVLRGAYVIEGKPSAVCSKCHKTTHKFTYPLEGGVHCSRCAYWE